MNLSSFKLRFMVSAGANVIKAGLGFVTGMLLARGLGPAVYGDMAFLLGTFLSIRVLLDMGSSSAFYTFISQRPRGPSFFVYFFAWLAVQFALTLAFVCWLAPDAIFHHIWLNQPRALVAMALLASFVQQPLWIVVGYVGESMRRTVQVQLLGVLVSMFYLVAVAGLTWLGRLDLEHVFVLLIAQYLIASGVAYLWWRKSLSMHAVKEPGWRQIWSEYRGYCTPMLALSLVAFCYSFLDRWLLQSFAGSTQQGFYQVASQFSLVSLLATTSIMNIFWKEIAAAWSERDHARVARLYQQVSRGLVLFSAALTALILPWAGVLLSSVLGSAYSNALPILMVMLCYPIHQSLGQVNGSMLLACGRTREQMLNGFIGMGISMPISYLLLAPKSAWLPGLGMGALGLALKMLIISLIAVNIQSWLIARYHGWRFDWRYQALGIPVLFALGWGIHAMLQCLPSAWQSGWPVLIVFAAAMTAFGVGVVFLVLRTPAVLGLGQDERALLAHALAQLWRTRS